jgi:2,3-bisphosphoglycerate-dependent phosphoglycerate mutase
MATVTLLRHGESLWNREKRFTGWIDVALTAHGIAQAERAGMLLAAHGFAFDVCFTSTLRRATETARIVLETMGASAVPVRESRCLNERHYGALQGLTRWEASRRYGALRVLAWQRQFAARPPALAADGAPESQSSRAPGAGRSQDRDPPRAESLADTLTRVLPFWEGTIVPELQRKGRVLVVSHHNTLRVLVKHLDGITDAGIVRVRIPTGKPLVYELDDSMRSVARFYVTRAPGRWSWGAAVSR